MTPDILINGISMAGLGWVRESIDFPAPEPQMETITVPGRNSPIRYTEALGRVSYEPRSFEVVLTMLGNRNAYNQMAELLINSFQGQLVKVICSEEPELYSYGTIKVISSYDPKEGRGEAVISTSDADSYRYHIDDTTVTIQGTAQAKLMNDYMPVIPKVTTTKETTLRWKIGTDAFEKTVSAGTWEFPELELTSGENTVSVTSEGVTTFMFKEGRL